ncbi:hypothetical protein [Phytomonospora endophytica]|uniref:Uncharacterized protein n=1 Tax=Phytomonospora endophytica TaxID=714109 RepID=A0A841FZX7_9ACTN|nr:hypothetical protein [Phytomonospora endophytica]MBB6039258.1 hypothetical protein [Phytomonospora endophytica]GIG69800.1 hypothetical protein Pen01_60950 [Phytomonospora endophytica]
MKIRCGCGALLPDGTDRVPYKARVLPDQDWEDVAHPRSAEAASAVLRRAADVYQCQDCGRLLFAGADGLVHRFAPEKPDVPRDLLRSVHGEAWQGSLRGSWRSGKGELWWEAGVEPDSGWEDVAELAELRRRYHEVFAERFGRGVLRDAFLRVDGVIEHEWQDADGDSPAP